MACRPDSKILLVAVRFLEALYPLVDCISESIDRVNQLVDCFICALLSIEQLVNVFVCALLSIEQLVNFFVCALLSINECAAYDDQVPNAGVLLFEFGLMSRLCFDQCLNGILDPG
jgi:hypothetical protein